MLPRFIRWKEQPLVGGLVQKMMIASRSVPALLHLLKGPFINDVAFNSVFPTLVPWGLVPTKGHPYMRSSVPFFHLILSICIYNWYDTYCGWKRVTVTNVIIFLVYKGQLNFEFFWEFISFKIQPWQFFELTIHKHAHKSKLGSWLMDTKDAKWNKRILSFKNLMHFIRSI